MMFLSLPALTRDEGKVVLEAIEARIAAFEGLREKSVSPDTRSHLAARLGPLYSLRTAFAEAIANHRRAETN